MSSFRGFSWPRDLTCISRISYIDRQVLYHRSHMGSSHSIAPRQLSSAFKKNLIQYFFNLLFIFHGKVNLNNKVYCYQRASWWLSGKESACQWGRRQRHRFDPRVGRIPWRRKWQPTPVFSPRESQGQRSLEDSSPWGSKELDMI